MSIFSRFIPSRIEPEFLVAGYFLYWGEGAKTTPYAVTLSNTDPAMMRAYIKWLELLNVPKEKMIVKLHLYRDMDLEKETKYWAKEIGLSKKHFRKAYIKKSNLSDLTYVPKGHGTCNVIVQSRDIADMVHQGLRHIKSLYL